MKRKILGFRLHFTSKKGNAGSLLFLGSEQPDVTGLAVESVWVPDNIPLPTFKLGDTVRVFYNSNGYLDSIELG